MTGRFAGNRCGRRRTVQGQGGWCSWFRCKKKVAGDSVVGTGLLLRASSQKAVEFFCVSLLVHVAGWQTLELWLQPEGSWLQRKFLEHMSAGLVLRGEKIWPWAKAKQWSKDSWGLYLIPTQV